MGVSQYDLKRQHSEISSELTAAFHRVLDSGIFMLHWGDAEVAALEQEIAAMSGLKHGVGCASGTDALMLVYRALGLGPGDEVIVPSFTFLATASSVRMVGATPVFADVSENSYCLTAETIKKALTPRTRAIVVAHLFGQLAEMTDIFDLATERNLFLIEDAAQAIGAKWCGLPAGWWGAAATLSFFPTKNLGGVGDGGMMLTRDDDLADKLRLIRNHGSRNGELGFNSRLDELQAAILRAKLPRLAEWNRQRGQVAERYNTAFSQLVPDRLRTPVRLQDNEHVYHQYVLRVTQREELRRKLAERKISSGIYYGVPLHRHPMMADCVPSGLSLPVSETLAREVLALPIFPGMTDTEVEEVISAVKSALA